MPVPIVPVVLTGMLFILMRDAERRQDTHEAVKAIPTTSKSWSAAQNGQKQTPSCLALASVAYGEKVCALLLT
jgi:hypothetical protein